MIDETRMGIYNYVYGLLYGAVTENVYMMNEPQELTESDVEDGFIVIRVGDIIDESEFTGETYGRARVFVEAYIPPISRGRLDIDKYTQFENDIMLAIKNDINVPSSEHYYIEEGSVLSMEDNDESNANNAYYMYIKSFIVNID